MIDHRVGTREQWLAERISLLEAEKELTRRGDEITRQRRELPWVRVDKDYRFDTETGPASLGDLFGGRSQLLVYHFMFPGCPSCAALTDGVDGSTVHLEHHDVAMVAICRTPLPELTAFRQRMGWRTRFVSPRTATSTTTSGSRSPTSSCCRARPTTSQRCRRYRPTSSMNGPVTFPVSVRSRCRTARSSTPTPRSPAAAMSCGRCTSGWIERRWGATKHPVGSACTMNTSRREPSDSGGRQICCGLRAPLIVDDIN